jgi:hypothetical protein
MMLLVSGKRRPHHEGRSEVGHLLCPRSRNAVWSERWAADNAAFSRFDEAAYVRMLDDIRGVPGCLFVTVPDVVGDHAATLALWQTWQPQLAQRGLPAAFVLQDGCGPDDVPWQSCDAVFVGGSTDYKLGSEARACVAEAKRRGVWTHMGRVNTQARLRYAQHIGCDSVDGSGFARFPDAMWPKWERIAGQVPLPC